MFQSPGSILFKLGPLTVRWYGLMIALGFIMASAAANRLAKRLEVDPERLINCGFVTFIGGVVGARLYFVALSWSYFQTHLDEILAIWNGGLSIHGGIIGGFLAGYVYCKRAHLSVLRYADIIGSVAPLGQAIGRWGNFFNSEAFGQPVKENYPLRLFIPQENRPTLYINNSFFHPTFLYESVWDLLLFLLIYFLLAPRLSKYPGLTFTIYIAGYSLGRLLIEPLRVDSIMIGSAQAPFVVSAAMLFLALASMPIIVQANRRATAG